MGIKKLLLAAASVAVLAGPASAMDRSGWYFGGGVGYGMVGAESSFDTPTTDYLDVDDGFGVFGSFGYAFHRHWRTELELGYRQNDVLPLIRRHDGGDVTQLTLMANLAYDINLSPNWAITLGAGAGIDRATLETAPFGDERDYQFAYQGIVGLDYQLNDHWDLTLEYRYLGANSVRFDAEIYGGISATPFNDPALEVDFVKHLVSIGFRYGYRTDAPPPPPPPPPPAIKTFIVFFGFNKYNLTAEAQKVVAEAAAAAQAQGAASILVTGHTDTVGGNAYNQKLSEKRSGAVKDELVRLGIGADKITATGKGETELLVQTGDGVKEPQNRRATIDLR